MSGTLFTTPRFRAVNSAGQPMAGAKLWFYQAGTNVLAPTWTTSALAVEHPNPQVADYQGEFRAIYLNPNVTYDYKAVLTTASGSLIWTEDNIPAGVASSGGGLPGEGRDDGLSVAEVRAYVRSNDPPATPSGGSFDFTTVTLSPPSGWFAAIPSGNEPIWISTAVAAIEGATGIDAILAWSTPVILAQDGASVDIIFRRASSQPSTPAPSPGVPVDWYTDVDSVPASTDTLWSSIGTRDNASQNWIWQVTSPSW